MDFREPLASIIPGSTGRILTVLGGTSAELNLSTVADLSGVSSAQASRVLPRLVEVGLVSRREVPPSSLFSLNRQHIVAPVIERLLNAPAEVPRRLAMGAESIAPRPVNMTLFGSAATRSATASSDIDVLVVRPDAADDDEVRWTETLSTWAEGAKRLLGNRISILEVGEAEARKLLRAKRPPWQDIARTGVEIMGRKLDELIDA